MDRFKVVAIPLALLLWIGTTMLFVEYTKDWQGEFEQVYLDTAVNYCVDAAVEDMTGGTSDLGLDYSDWEFVKIDPDIAMDTFCAMMCENLGFSPSTENKAYIKANYISTFCVAGYDGYYMAEDVNINSKGGTDLVFKPKQSYTYKAGDGQVYALNLGLNYAYKYNQGNREKVQLPAGLTVDLNKAVINETISDAFSESMYRVTEKSTLHTFYLPKDLSNISRTNPIESVTVLAYVRGVKLLALDPIDSFAIGGARIAHEKFVVCYVREGQKYYTYADTYPGGENVIGSYENPMKAAQNGYMFDMKYCE